MTSFFVGVGGGEGSGCVGSDCECLPKGVSVRVSGMLGHSFLIENRQKCLLGSPPGPQQLAGRSSRRPVNPLPHPPAAAAGGRGGLCDSAPSGVPQTLARDIKKPCCFWEIPKKENERKHGNMCQHEFSFTGRKLADTIHHCRSPRQAQERGFFPSLRLNVSPCSQKKQKNLVFKRRDLRPDGVRSSAFAARTEKYRTHR